jgi:uncharacterized protein
VYCYEKFKQGTMRPEVREGVRNLLTQRAPTLNNLAISWFGGEPLYGWEAVEELSPFAQRIGREHGFKVPQNMTTNAYLLTEERATKLLEWGCNRYQITLDGLAEDHDCKRVGRDGSPTYGVILENLRSMAARRDAEFQIAIRINFDQKNFNQLGSFLESLSEDFGGDPRFVLRFRAVGKWGGENDENLETCGREQEREVVDQVQRKAREVSLQSEAGIRGYAKPGQQVCYAARPFNFIVGASGKLMKCTIALDELEDNVVGQLHPDGRLELNDERMSIWVSPHFESDKVCQNCYVLPVCQGAQCPLSRVVDNTRSCAPIKGTLKREMRYTLSEAEAPARPQDLSGPRGATPAAVAGPDPNPRSPCSQRTPRRRLPDRLRPPPRRASARRSCCRRTAFPARPWTRGRPSCARAWRRPAAAAATCLPFPRRGAPWATTPR